MPCPHEPDARSVEMTPCQSPFFPARFARNAAWAVRPDRPRRLARRPPVQ